MPVFETPEPISVTVDLAVGSVQIVASDRTDTVVEVRPGNESKAADIKAAEETRVEYADGRLQILGPKGWKRYSFLGPGESIDVTIKLPTGSRVNGETAVGGFRAEGQLGDCTLKTAVGNISLERTGALVLSTDSGDIAVDSAAGHAEITNGSGAVRIREVDGAATIKNSHGSTAIGEVAGELQVKTASGQISVDRAHASVVAKTAYGKVRIGEVTRGSILLESSYGELEVGIREGTAAWLDLSSQHGRVRNSLNADDGPRPSDETVEVRARTAYGDIVIRRSTEKPSQMRSKKS